ncbi:glycine--tRNA ligase [bacterium]|nr:glycine--tRNA ligase [bacterium]
MQKNIMEALVSLCKRRGFIFQSSEIYGGLNGCWDYGPLGVLMKNNVKNEWWKENVQEREDVVGMDCSILMHPEVWVASGHVGNFNDPMIDCKSCKSRFRADHLTERVCPNCSSTEFTEVKNFNLMFQTKVGASQEDSSIVYLRPETAQGIFVNFDNVVNTSRQKVPFGIAQMGKSFRNEINPRNFVFRVREFEQMELEFFCHPNEADEWFKFWVEKRFAWYKNLGIKSDRLKLREHEKDELAHYAKGCFDVEYEFPFGFCELEGIAHRSDFDLSQHTKQSGKSLQFFDEEKKEKFTPFVIESSAGVDRSLLTFLADAYDETDPQHVVLRLHPKLAPIKVAIFPLTKKDGLPEIAQNLRKDLAKYFNVVYETSGSIGKRYYRQDEIGTPFCLTVDYDSRDKGTVTIRHRDSGNQDLVSIDKVVPYFLEKLF